ncbi:MAG: alpha/beta fold hydrolase [Agromyces sp.]
MPGTFVYPERLAELRPVEHSAVLATSRTVWWDYPPREPQRGSQDTVVAIHGFRGDHHGLELFAAFWPEQRIIIPDLPGFGESAPFVGHQHTIEQYAVWLTAFLEELRPNSGRLIVLGHSFGSIIVSAALANGLRVDRAILVNPISAPALEGPRGLLTKAAIAYYRIGALLPERLGHLWLGAAPIVRVMSEAMAKNRDPLIRQFVHEQHRMYFSTFANRTALLEAFEASVSHNVAEYASQIAVPLLLIAAEQDDITPIEAQYRMAEATPQAELRVIPHVGHLVHYETPAVAVEHMRDFLALR